MRAGIVEIQQGEVPLSKLPIFARPDSQSSDQFRQKQKQVSRLRRIARKRAIPLRSK